MALERQKLFELYRKMILVRAMEVTHARLLQEGTISLMEHFGTGQEAVAIGVAAPMIPVPGSPRLERLYLPDADSIIRAVKRIV